MRVKALKNLNDLEKNAYRKKDDEFEVTKERFAAMNGTEYGLLVEAIDEESVEFPKHTGGGYYELSNGDKVKGKAKAFQAENELK